MQIWLRITLLAVCTAIGIAVALGVALNKPAAAPKSPVARRIVATASVTPEPPGAPAPSVAAPPFVAAPVVAPYRDPVARQVGQLEETLQELEESTHRRERSMMRALAALQDRIDDTAPKPAPPTAEELPADDQQPATTDAVPEVRVKPSGESYADVRRDEGDNNYSLNVQGSDIRAVLEMISKAAGLNIIASRKVTGPVTANLSGVDLETALAAILKSTGFAAAREGNILYVGEPTDLQLMNLAQDHITTRVYRPNYAKAADLQALFTPLISTDGKITVTTASQIDIPADQTKTGGNGFAGIDTIVVRDYETVLLQLDEIFAEVDTKPRQVALEAMILSVKLDDKFKFGVNFSALRDQANTALISGTPANGIGSITVGDGGLHFGFLDATVGLFLDCLESIGDTNVIASPRLMCLNKQRAEIQIGQELGYVSTTVTPTS